MDDIQIDFYMHQYLKNGGKDIVEDETFDQDKMLARLAAGLELDDFEEI